MPKDEADRLSEIKGTMTEEDLGQILGYSRKTVNSFLNRRRKITDRVYTGLALHFGRDVAEYVRTGNKPASADFPPKAPARKRDAEARVIEELGNLKKDELERVLEFARLLKSTRMKKK